MSKIETKSKLGRLVKPIRQVQKSKQQVNLVLLGYYLILILVAVFIKPDPAITFVALVIGYIVSIIANKFVLRNEDYYMYLYENGFTCNTLDGIKHTILFDEITDIKHDKSTTKKVVTTTTVTLNDDIKIELAVKNIEKYLPTE